MSKYNNRLRPFRDAAYTALVSTKEAFTVKPKTTIAVWTVSLFFMVIPSLQVQLVKWAVDSVSAGSLDSGFQILVIALLVTFGAVSTGIFAELSDYITELLRIGLRAYYNSDFSKKLSHITPAQTIDHEITTQIQATRNALPFNVSWQASSTVKVIGAIISMVFLIISLWDIDNLAAILIGLALIPGLFANARLATLENNIWGEQAKIIRRAEYFEYLQDFLLPARR